MKPGGWARDLLRLLLPSGCVACGAWLPDDRSGAPLTCALCRSRLRVAPWPRCPRCDLPRGTGASPAPDCMECRGWDPALTRARHAVVLAPPADALVHGLKYEGWGALAHEMGRAMADRITAPPGAVVVPVPTTEARLRERGYNQAERLARVVAARVERPVVHALLRRPGGATQVALSPSRRRANVMGAFAVADPGRAAIRGAPVVLVDDVLTTGATAGAAAAALAGGGAGAVVLITYARALPYRRPTGR